MANKMINFSQTWTYKSQKKRLIGGIFLTLLTPNLATLTSEKSGKLYSTN